MVKLLLRTAFPKPLPIARACTPENWTGEYLRAFFAANRCASCSGVSLARSIPFVAGPNFSISQAATKSDQEPRGSLGSQKP